MKKSKFILCFILAVAMLVSVVPFGNMVFAADKDYKFKYSVSSNANNGTVGNVTGTVYDDYSADIVFTGSAVNRSNAKVEIWMKNVASLGVSDPKYYVRNVETGLTGEDTSMDNVKARFNGFNEETTFNVTVNGDKKMSYKVKNEIGSDMKVVKVNATPSSFQEAHDVWYAITAEENKNIKTTHDGERDSFFLIKNGSWLQVGDQKVEFEGSDDLKIDNVGKLEDIYDSIEAALALNTVEAGEEAEGIVLYFEPGTVFSVGASSVELLKDARVTVKMETEDLIDSIKALQKSEDSEALIKDILAFIENVITEVGGKSNDVDIEFGHKYPAQDEDENNPTWEWAEDYSWAKATFTCTNNDTHEKETFDATVTSKTEGGKIIYTATVTVNGEEYTDTKEVQNDIIVIPYPAERFTENLDDKDPTNDANATYTINGHTVTVKYTYACKIGYLKEGATEYTQVIPETSDDPTDQYTFEVPNDINEVILVVKGDLNLSGTVTNTDITIGRSYVRRMRDIDLIPKFAAEVNDDGRVTNADITVAKAQAMYLRNMKWYYENN